MKTSILRIASCILLATVLSLPVAAVEEISQASAAPVQPETIQIADVANRAPAAAGGETVFAEAVMQVIVWVLLLGIVAMIVMWVVRGGKSNLPMVLPDSKVVDNPVDKKSPTPGSV